MHGRSQNRNGEISGPIEDERPIKRESPDILGAVEVVGVGIVSREWIVKRRERGDFVVDRDTVVGHSPSGQFRLGQWGRLAAEERFNMVYGAINGDETLLTEQEAGAAIRSNLLFVPFASHRQPASAGDPGFISAVMATMMLTGTQP